jgi:catechol-2,3-dioxygenase
MHPQLFVISLWAQDVAEAAHFYRDVIGLTLTSHQGGRPHFRLGEAYLVILQGRPIPPEDPTPSRFPQLALMVNDLQQAIARLNQAKVELPWGIEEDAVSEWVMFHDPGGNLVELVQLKG